MSFFISFFLLSKPHRLPHRHSYRAFATISFSWMEENSVLHEAMISRGMFPYLCYLLMGLLYISEQRSPLSTSVEKLSSQKDAHDLRQGFLILVPSMENKKRAGPKNWSRGAVWHTLVIHGINFMRDILEKAQEEVTCRGRIQSRIEWIEWMNFELNEANIFFCHSKIFCLIHYIQSYSGSIQRFIEDYMS